MFDAKTVFILGAGASCHYGYPTGEDLVGQVIDKAEIATSYFTEANRKGAVNVQPNILVTSHSDARNPPSVPPDDTTSIQKQWGDAISKCNDLANRLRSVNPLVIDYFIGHNRHLEDFGKLCIAWVILQREAAHISTRNGKGFPTNANWCRFLLHKLVTGCPDGRSLLRNNVTFVTFNYDVSLEIELHRGLNSLYEFEGVAKQFLNDDRVLHGKIREDPLSPPPALINWDIWGSASIIDRKRKETPPSQIWDHPKKLLDIAYDASKKLQVIAPDKVTTTPTIEKAKQAIAEAECIYILGYGFDRFNSDLLKLTDALDIRKNLKKVMFTNYQNKGFVNKNASRLMFHNSISLLEDRAQVVGGGRDKFLCEKSIRTVYEALAHDFDSPEEQPEPQPPRGGPPLSPP